VTSLRSRLVAHCLIQTKELEQWSVRSLALVSREISIPLQPDPWFLSGNAFALDSSVFTIKVLCCTAPVAIRLTFGSAFGLPHLVRPSADSGITVLLFLTARRLFLCALILLLSGPEGRLACCLFSEFSRCSVAASFVCLGSFIMALALLGSFTLRK
jgi:hypothetical protein